MCGAHDANVRSSTHNVRSSTPWHRCAQRRKFGVSEIRNFRHYSNTRNIPASDDPSCPVLSCPVLWSRSFRTDVRINADEKRTRCGRKADTNPSRTLRTRFGLKLGVSRHRRRRAGHLSHASACGHRWTSVRIKADRMRTKSGQMSASKRTKCGQDADAASPLERVACGVGGESLDAQRIESMADEVRRGRFCPNFPPHDPSRSGYLGQRPSSSFCAGTVATPARSVTCGEGPSMSVRVGQGPILAFRCFPS